MKALKSKLADQILRSGARIPLSDGDKLVFQGVKYVVKIVPKRSGPAPLKNCC